NPSTPSIVLDSGEEIRGHLVIAADGVHSAGPEAILGRPNDPVPAALGNCCYRFLIPVQRLQEDPDTSFFVENHHGWTRMLIDEDRGRKMVVYPCRDNTLLNFACVLHEEAGAPGNGSRRENRHEAVDTARISDRLAGFDARFRKVVGKATDVRRWPLVHHHPLPTWNKGRMTLAGDAAHPILPRELPSRNENEQGRNPGRAQTPVTSPKTLKIERRPPRADLGQGGAQALEDGLALGIVFSGACSPDEIDDRLALYLRSRRGRASAIQILSNVGGDDACSVGEELLRYMSRDEIPKDLSSASRYCLAFDVVRATVDVMTMHDPLFKLADGFFEKPVIGVPKGKP
ncbi:hypothetical protein E4U53_002944, partial [Claviceps sorghi]